MNPSADTVLEVNGVSYSYPNGRRGLDDVRFTISTGEIVGIVGPSGAGKSTLLLHLNGLLPQHASNGRKIHDGAPIRVGGLTVEAANLAEVRRMVGFLFQDPNDQLFCPTVREDVAFGPLNLALGRSEVERRIAESLAAVRLDGYESRSTLQLSLGERSASAWPECWPATRSSSPWMNPSATSTRGPATPWSTFCDAFRGARSSRPMSWTWSSSSARA